MTQMGLEYAKLKETGRHNLADEAIRSQSNVIQQQEADTKKYVASFEPIKTDATAKQAQAALQQADTAKGRLSLDSKYRERETRAKERTADSSVKQAQVASDRLSLDTDYRERETAAKEASAAAQKSQAESAAKQAETQFNKVLMENMDTGGAAYRAAILAGQDPISANIAGINAILDRLVPKISIKN